MPRAREQTSRGEIVLVIGAAEGGTAALEDARGAVERLVDAGAKRRAAAAVVSSLTGLPTNRLYGRDRSASS